MEHVNCNLCGSAELRPVYTMPDAKFAGAEWFTVVECVHCGLGFLNPRPTADEIGRYYPAEYYDYLSPEKDRARYQRQRDYLASVPVPTGRRPRLLDVGCANGDFPRFMMRQGWEVEGIEVSAVTNPVTDFVVHTTDFPSAPVAPHSFDAVTAWAVLEHVHDPMSYFRAAARALRPGGLFVLNVPSFTALSSRRLFREDIPRHLYFFSDATIRRYLSAAGLQWLSTRHGNDVYEMRPTNWLRYLLMYRALGRPMAYADLPERPEEYFARTGSGPTLAAKIGYVLTHPFTVLDWTLMPAFERLIIWKNNYGMITVVARAGDDR